MPINDSRRGFWPGSKHECVQDKKEGAQEEACQAKPSKTKKRQPKTFAKPVQGYVYDPKGVFDVMRSGLDDDRRMEFCGIVMPHPPELDYSHLVPPPPGPFGQRLLKKGESLDKALRAALDALQSHGHDIETLNMHTLDLDMCSEDRCRVAIEMFAIMADLNGWFADESNTALAHLAIAAECAVEIGQKHVQLVAMKKDPIVLSGHRSGKGPSSGGKATAKKRKAEQAARDAEMFPDGPNPDESLADQAYEKMHTEGLDPDKRLTSTEERARRRSKGPLQKKRCDYCPEMFQPVRRDARQCPKCRNRTRTDKLKRREKFFGY